VSWDQTLQFRALSSGSKHPLYFLPLQFIRAEAHFQFSMEVNKAPVWESDLSAALRVMAIHAEPTAFPHSYPLRAPWQGYAQEADFLSAGQG
jgi:hypothetical protein